MAGSPVISGRTVGVTHRIAAPAAAVWALMATPGNLELGHPFCAANPVKVWPGPNSHDEVHYLNGHAYVRRFRQWLEGVGYDLEIGAAGEATSFVSWRVEPAGTGSCELTITVHPRPIHEVPRALRWPVGVAYVGPLLRRYLSSVARGFEWYVRVGEAVSPNQFGSHPWFSAPR